MFRNEVGFNPLESVMDKLRGGGQTEFWKRYKKIDDKTLAQIPYSSGDLENAFQHAYTSAKIGYRTNEEIARYLGYLKELSSKTVEINNNGKTNAYLDTNRDLWNNIAGIKYAMKSKKQGKTIDEVADDIFNQIIKKDSDFIVDFRNDKRRWDPSSNEDNLWNHVGKQFIPKQIKQGVKTIKNTIKNINNKQKATGTLMHIGGIAVDTDNVSIYGKKWNDLGDEDKKAFFEGLRTGAITKEGEKRAKLREENWTKKFNIGNPETDKGHWVTLDNGKHLFIKDR